MTRLFKNGIHRLVFCVILVSFLCTFGSAGSDPSVEIAFTTSHPPPALSADPSLYPQGEAVRVNISIKNDGTGSITLQGFPPGIRVTSGGGRAIRSYPRSASTPVLAQGRTISTGFEWDQKDENGNPVDPGMYTIAVNYLYSPGNDGVWNESRLSTATRSTKILVQPPQGFLEKEIEVHQSKTDDGVTATLESLQCGSTNTTAFFQVELPEKNRYASSRPAGLMPCDANAYPTAYFSIDQGPLADVSDARFMCDSSPVQVYRVELIFEPVPSDAESIDIFVTEFGNHKGAWNYHIDFNAFERPGSVTETSLPASTTHPAGLPTGVVIGSICIFGIIAVWKNS